MKSLLSRAKLMNKSSDDIKKPVTSAGDFARTSSGSQERHV